MAHPARISLRADAAFAPLLDLGELRVWSLIVTILGDFARGEDQVLSGRFLSDVTGRLGVKPEAMRVALHRLRRDGWIESHRAGRGSFYGFTAFGRAQAERAAARIYAPGPTTGPWHLLIAAPVPQATRNGQDQALIDAGYGVLAPGVYLGAGKAPDIPGMLAFTGDTGPVPEWLRKQVLPTRLAADYTALARALAETETAADDVTDDIDRAALRVLVVHTWRRVLLRHPDLPGAFLGGALPVETCRAQVLQLLECLPVPASNGTGCPAPGHTV